MSIFQCQQCGCAENTATSNWAVNVCEGRPVVCSVCDHEIGLWHGEFKRVYLPKGSCFTNGEGNLQHIESGLTGSKLYAAYGSDKEFE